MRLAERHHTAADYNSLGRLFLTTKSARSRFAISITTSACMSSTINPIHSSSSAAAESTLAQSFNEWKATRTLVSDAIRSYLDACATLHAVWTSSSSQSLGHPLLEEELVTIDTELESLAADAQSLLDTRIPLATMRNTSTTLARINTLPPEILADIFRLSGGPCSRSDEYNLYDLMSVCTYWKEAVLNTTDLRNHVDIGPQTLGRLTNFAFERAKGCPVHLHIYEAELEEGGAAFSDFAVYEMMRSLIPYMSQVRILDLEVYSSSRPNFVKTMLIFWLDGTTSRLKSLKVHLPNTQRTLHLARFSCEDETIDASSDDANGTFPLTTLHLQNVKFDWRSGIYCGLTDLRLDFKCDIIDINISQLAHVLSSSPELTILKLSQLTVNNGGYLRQFAPITLGYLKVFYLEAPHFSSVELLLSLIALSSASTQLGLYIQNFDQIIHRLQTFFARSKPSMLYWLHYDRSLAYWLPISKSIPPLRTLVLDRLDMEHDGRPGPPHNSVSVTGAFSRIDCAILLRCVVNLEGLKTLISLHGIRNLRLEACTTIGGRGRTLYRVRSSLLEVYPELECSISNTDSTSNHPCRVVFDQEAS